MFGQPKRWQSNYLGGHYAFAKSKSAVLIISDIGIEARSAFMGKLMFTIPWDEIVDLGQDLLHKQEQSALGGIAQGIGMMSAGSGGGLAGYSLQSAGQAANKNVTEHYLEIKYLVEGISGVAIFEFKPMFWERRPVLEFISEANKIRIELKKKSA